MITAFPRLCWLALSALFWACGPSVDEQVERLAGSPEEREQARQELLLAKDRAVAPLLQALDDPGNARGRIELVDVLVSLMSRVDDPRIIQALNRVLVNDPDPKVRARVAQRVGLFKQADAIPALLKALEDEDGEVRYQAILGLEQLEAKLDENQIATLQEQSHALLEDAHAGVRMEAMIQVENFVNEWIKVAQQQALKAKTASAESLLHRTLVYSPHSKQGNYRLARFYLENGRKEEGLDLLRQHGMLLDVPQLTNAPEIDGRLDESVWQQAACADSFYQFVGGHTAALPSEVRTHFCLGYTRDALFVGFRAHDDHPDSLVVKTRDFDGNVWWEDTAEIYLDANFDHRSYVHVGINSIGVVSDAWHPNGLGNQDEAWNAPARFAASVGDDFWAFEGKFQFRGKELPQPRSGDIWGFNLVRVFRGSEYSQWVRTYGPTAHTPDDFGLLLFQ